MMQSNITEMNKIKIIRVLNIFPVYWTCEYVSCFLNISFSHLRVTYTSVHLLLFWVQIPSFNSTVVYWLVIPPWGRYFPIQFEESHLILIASMSPYNILIYYWTYVLIGNILDMSINLWIIFNQTIVDPVYFCERDFIAPSHCNSLLESWEMW